MNEEETTQPSAEPQSTETNNTTSQDKWVETKREYEIDEIGNERIRKITRELEKQPPSKTYLEKHKDLIDIALKGIGLITIITPLFVLYFQQKGENQRKKAERQIELYTNLSMLLHSMSNLETNNTTFDSLLLQVKNNYSLKAKLLNDKDILKEIEDVSFTLQMHRKVNIVYTRYTQIMNMLIDSIHYSVKEKTITRQAISPVKIALTELIDAQNNMNESIARLKLEDSSKRMDDVFLDEINLIVIVKTKQLNTALNDINNNKGETSILRFLSSRILTNEVSLKHNALTRLSSLYRKYLDTKLDMLDKDFIKANSIYQ